MRLFGWWWWAALALVMWVDAAPSSEEKAGNRMDDPSSSAANSIDDLASVAGAAAASVAASQIPPAGGLFGPQLRTILGALENVDEMLRTTIPTIDRFQCIERLMCSVMTPSVTDAGSQAASFIQQAFDPTFQQGVIQDPQTVSQELLQNPALQGLFSQGQGSSSQTSALQGLQGLFSQGQGSSSQTSALQGLQQLLSQGSSQNPSLQGLLSQVQQLQQSSSVQNPALQQGFPPPNPALEQGFPPQNPAFQQPFPPQGFPPQNPAFPPGFAQEPTFQNPAFLPPPPPPHPGFNPQFQAPPEQVVHGGFQTFQPFQDGTSFQNSFPNFRENPDTQGTHRRTNIPRPQRRRRPSKRPQRNGFFDFLGRLGLGRRKKRSLVTDVISAFSGERVMGLLDQMMTQYSFYPYTHAAFMGYTGSSRRCETLYPSCPSTAEEMIDVFNNIHRHYPDGIPYKENLPWPLNILLP